VVLVCHLACHCDSEEMAVVMLEHYQGVGYNSSLSSPVHGVVMDRFWPVGDKKQDNRHS